MLSLSNFKSGLATIVFLLAFYSNASAAGCEADAMVCQVNTISIVSLTFTGSNSKELSPHKGQLIDFLRLRLRNDLSFLRHEGLSFKEFVMVKAPGDKEKAYLECSVVTASDSAYPVAIYVSCLLSSMGDYERSWGEVEGKALSYTSSTGLLVTTKEMLSDAVEAIAINFFEAQDLHNM